MKPLVVIALLLAAGHQQARRWTSVATGPEQDPVGLYVDTKSINGTFPVKTVWLRFLNSLGEENLSLVEMNCAHHSARTLSEMRRAPNGSVLKSRKFATAKSTPIDSLQRRAEPVVCKAQNVKTKTRANHRKSA